MKVKEKKFRMQQELQASLPVDNVEGVHVLQGKHDLGCVEFRSLLSKASDFAQVEEKFATSAIIENKK